MQLELCLQPTCIQARCQYPTQRNSWPEGSRGGHGSRTPASHAWSATSSASGASAGTTLPCAPRRCARAGWLGLGSCAWPTAVRGSWTARRRSGVWRRAAALGGSASCDLGRQEGGDTVGKRCEHARAVAARKRAVICFTRQRAQQPHVLVRKAATIVEYDAVVDHVGVAICHTAFRLW